MINTLTDKILEKTDNIIQQSINIKKANDYKLEQIYNKISNIEKINNEKLENMNNKISNLVKILDEIKQKVNKAITILNTDEKHLNLDNKNERSCCF